MAVFAIGDVQGCKDELDTLLDRLRFDASCDRLWFVGDLVNRGPRSLDTLRFVKSLGDAAITVLGNHDLHLLALARGGANWRDGDAGLRPIVDAPDADELLDWLQARPLLHHDANLGISLLHAGLPDAVDRIGRADAGGFENRRHDVDHMHELLAQRALVLDACRPRHDHVLVDAASLRADRCAVR